MSVALLKCGWLNTNIKFKKDLVLVIARTQKPVGFKAKNICMFNFESFLTVRQ